MNLTGLQVHMMIVAWLEYNKTNPAGNEEDRVRREALTKELIDFDIDVCLDHADEVVLAH